MLEELNNVWHNSGSGNGLLERIKTEW
jgi:hypothetical protein